MSRDPFEDFDRSFNRFAAGAAIIGVMWALFWAGVVVTVLVLLWRNFG